MGKTNYTKVEEALAEGLRKHEVDKLLSIADENSGKNPKPSGTPQETEKAKVSTIHLQRLLKVDADLQTLEKKGKLPYARLKIDKEEIKKFVSNPADLTPNDWEKIKTIKEQIAAYQAELERRVARPTEEDFVKQQSKKQKSKRFNVNEKWIPLH